MDLRILPLSLRGTTFFTSLQAELNSPFGYLTKHGMSIRMTKVLMAGGRASRCNHTIGSWYLWLSQCQL